MLQNVKHKVSSVIPAGKRLLKTALSAENYPVWRGRRWAERGEAMMRRRRHPPRVESGAGQSLARDGVMRHGMPREMFLSASWHRPLRSDNCPLWLLQPEVVYF
ncbi:TPA: hypothetical protein MIG43_16025 [Klebsiella pneumoniae]|nr:hypothetical protein [Klebsiella pneumoniae]